MSESKAVRLARVEERLGKEAALREADDRRNMEVAVEREKALKIKETGDLAALGLARENQLYRDERANNLRDQLTEERGNYATKADLSNLGREINASIKPLTEFVSATRGGTSQVARIGGFILGAAVILGSIIAAVVAVTA